MDLLIHVTTRARIRNGGNWGVEVEVIQKAYFAISFSFSFFFL